MPKYRRGSGSVYRRGKTYWIGYYNPKTKKQVCESAKTTAKAKARELLQMRLGQLVEGTFVGPAAERVTFEDLREGVLTDYQVNGKKSIRCARIKMNKHLTPFFRGKRAHEITTADIKAYTAQRQQQGASNGEINRELSLLRRMFNLALQEEKITKKPYVPLLEENNVRKGFFEQWEFHSVFAKLPDYLKPPFSFAYVTGWRIQSEILPLLWNQVDLEAGTVRLEVGTTKNKEGRVIYLTEELQALLMQQWQEHVSQHPQCPFVFHCKGKQITRYDKAWNRACRESGLSGKIPHDFRRTAVRNMVRAVIPERVAMQMSGHKTRDVFDRYHIVSDGDLREAARRLSQRIVSQTTTSLTTILPLPVDQMQLTA